MVVALIQLGDVPAWVSSATALYLGLRGQRRTQALDWAQTLQELAGVDSEELRREVEANPVVGEIVGLAWEKAAETASVDKRRLLAKVAAAALRGDATPGEIDAQQLLLRTVTALDPIHVTLLVIIGRLEDRDTRPHSPEERRADRAAMEAEWPSPPDLLDPALAALEREGLAYSVLDYSGAPRGWKLRPYGRRFLDHLLIDEGGWPPYQPEA
jgi:hypothetical protein